MERMGNISAEARKNTRRNIPTKEKRHRNSRTKMGHTNGKMGNRKRERGDRSSIQKKERPTKRDRQRRKRTSKTTKNKKQREILMTWKEAADYMKKNEDKIKYSRIPIVDLGSRKEKEKYRARKHSKRNKKAINEYTDWNHGETFENNPITKAGITID